MGGRTGMGSSWAETSQAAAGGSREQQGLASQFGDDAMGQHDPSYMRYKMDRRGWGAGQGAASMGADAALTRKPCWRAEVGEADQG